MLTINKANKEVEAAEAQQVGLQVCVFALLFYFYFYFNFIFTRVFGSVLEINKGIFCVAPTRSPISLSRLKRCSQQATLFNSSN